jgi:CheY-like chemotaxis protein
MQIFLLEDSYERMRRFRALFQNHFITHSADSKEAIEILSRESFDLICLDHDLNEHDNDWIASGDGYEVASFLGSNETPNKNALILIHTMNPSGGDRMFAALEGKRVVRTSIIEIFNLNFLRSVGVEV